MKNEIDIEDLLDELGMSIDKKQSNTKAATKPGLIGDIVIDDLINELGIYPPTQFSSQTSVTAESTKFGASKTKCKPPYIGRKDKDTLMVPCNKLRCLNCDFNCVTLMDRTWMTTLDYLFFRNHFPDQEKILKGTTRKVGWVAVCCQCAWVSVAPGQCKAVSECNEKLRWVCAGH